MSSHDVLSITSPMEQKAKQKRPDRGRRPLRGVEALRARSVLPPHGVAPVRREDALVLFLVNRLHAAAHEVHEEVVAEGFRGGEVGFAAAHGAHLLDELDEGEVAREHEGVDHDWSVCSG